MNLQVLDTGISEAVENMSLDAKLLTDLDPLGNPILHLYDWARPSATYGHFILPEKHLDLTAAAHRNLALAKRPTGGGIVFHIWDLAFSFLMPASHPLCSQNTLENYQFVNRAVLDAVSEYFHLDSAVLIPSDAPAQGPACNHFCMARPTIYDVVYKGAKIAGAAQRRTKQGYLHQGTISLAYPDLELLTQVLLSKAEITNAMSAYSFAPLKNGPIQEARRAIQELLKQKFLARIG